MDKNVKFIRNVIKDLRLVAVSERIFMSFIMTGENKVRQE